MGITTSSPVRRARRSSQALPIVIGRPFQSIRFGENRTGEMRAPRFAELLNEYDGDSGEQPFDKAVSTAPQIPQRIRYAANSAASVIFVRFFMCSANKSIKPLHCVNTASGRFPQRRWCVLVRDIVCVTAIRLCRAACRANKGRIKEGRPERKCFLTCVKHGRMMASAWSENLCDDDNTARGN